MPIKGIKIKVTKTEDRYNVRIKIELINKTIDLFQWTIHDKHCQSKAIKYKKYR